MEGWRLTYMGRIARVRTSRFLYDASIVVDQQTGLTIITARQQLFRICGGLIFFFSSSVPVFCHSRRAVSGKIYI